MAFTYDNRHWRPEAHRRRMLECLPLRDALERCQSEAEVRELAELRGYKPGFVWHVLRARRVAAAADASRPPWSAG